MKINRIALIAITLAASQLAWGTNASVGPQDDPTVTRVVFCHGNYAMKHAASTATATEIATAAASACRRELDEAAESTYQKALSVGLPLSNAVETKNQFVEHMKDYLPGFVIGLVIERRGQDSNGG